MKSSLLKWSVLLLVCGGIAVGLALFFAQQADKGFDTSLEKISLEDLKKLSASKDHNRDPMVYYWLGVRLSEAKQDREATTALTRSVMLNPNLAKSRYALGVALDQVGHPQEAEGQLKKALELEPNRADIYLVMGKMYGKYGKFREAEQSLRKAVQLSPEAVEPSFLLSVLLLEIAHRTTEPLREEARDILLKLEKRAPKDTRVLSLLASSHVFFNQIKEAEALYRRILQIDPNDLKTKALLGRSLAEQADTPEAFAEAEKLLQECAQNDQKNSAIPMALGTLYQRQGKSAQAIPYFRKAIEQKNTEPEVWYHLARALLQTGQAAEGQKVMAVFTKRDKNRRDIRSLQMRLGFEAEETPEQIKQSDALHLQLARLLMEDGNYLTAGQHLQAILSHDSNHAEANRRLQQCQEKTNAP